MPGMGGGHAGGGGHGGGGGHSGGGFGGGPRPGGFGGGPRPGGFGGGPRPGGFGPHGPGGFGPHPHNHHRPRGFFWGPGWGWGWGPRYGGGCLGGFVVMIVVFVMIILITAFSFIGAFFAPEPEHEYPWGSEVEVLPGDSVSITPSTSVRTPLEPSYVNFKGDFYYDGAGMLETSVDQANVIAGLKHFYASTGVQPYLYLARELDGNKQPSYADIEKFMFAKYSELFDDEGSLIVLYFEYPSGEYNTWWICGDDAMARVMDDEACEILLDYIDYYYNIYGTDDYSALFSNAITDAADRIMGGITPSEVSNQQGGQPAAKPKMSVGGVIGILLLIAAIVAVAVWIIVGVKKNNGGGGNGTSGTYGSDSSDSSMSEEDRRKEKYRRKYGGGK